MPVDLNEKVNIGVVVRTKVGTVKGYLAKEKGKELKRREAIEFIDGMTNGNSVLSFVVLDTDAGTTVIPESLLKESIISYSIVSMDGPI